MVQTYMAAYAAAWTLTTVVAIVSGRHLTMVSDGPAHPLLASLFAGAVWPILVLGLVEASLLIIVDCVQSVRRPSPAASRGAAEVVHFP